MMQFLQRIGKAIMLPIAALPIAGILLGIGGAFLGIATLQDAPAIYKGLISFVNIPAVTAVLTVMKNIGDIVFGNLPLLFAVGVAVGLAKKDKGTAALASVFGFIVMNQVISTLLGLGVTQLGVLTPDNVGIPQYLLIVSDPGRTKGFLSKKDPLKLNYASVKSEKTSADRNNKISRCWAVW